MSKGFDTVFVQLFITSIVYEIQTERFQESVHHRSGRIGMQLSQSLTFSYNKPFVIAIVGALTKLKHSF